MTSASLKFSAELNKSDAYFVSPPDAKRLPPNYQPLGVFAEVPPPQTLQRPPPSRFPTPSNRSSPTAITSNYPTRRGPAPRRAPADCLTPASVSHFMPFSFCSPNTITIITLASFYPGVPGAVSSSPPSCSIPSGILSGVSEPLFSALIKAALHRFLLVRYYTGSQPFLGSPSQLMES